MSLLGDGMLVRLRSASIALFGLATLVGLGLIVFIAQLGFPGVFSSPIPGDSSKAGSVGGAIALAQGRSVDSHTLLRSGRRATTFHAHRGVHSPADADLGDSRSLAASPAAGPSPAVASPPPVPASTPSPASEPASQPGTSAPLSSPPSASAPDSVPVSEPKASSEEQAKPTRSKPKSKSKSKGSTAAKATSDKGSKPDASSPGKSKGHAGKGSGYYAPPSKSNDDSSDKAEEEQVSSPPKTTVPPPVDPKSKEASEVPEKSAGKEAVDSGKSDKSRH